MINFKKISAITSSVLMVGMTMGVAAAANFPAPFVVGGSADVAVVYGTGSGVSVLDAIEAGNIQANLQSYMTGTSGGASTSTSGEIVSLDTSSSRIWLNTSLNTAKSTLTKTDLPTVLADYTFEGSSSSKLTSTIKLIAGNTATNPGSANTGTVVFLKQPRSSDDPVFGISMGTGASSYPLYNASATMSAINFTHADSEGEDIVLFGQTFTISSDTDTTDLVLLKESQKFDLSSDAPSVSVTIGDAEYTVELISASDTAATVKVTDSAGVGETKEINEADSKKVNGIQIAVKTADETNLKLSASVIAGAQKLTLTSGSAVTEGDSSDPIDGTTVYIIGGTGAATEIAISVYRPDSSTDAILPGESFVDPVFGSFKVDFAGLSNPEDSTTRDTITVGNSGDDTMSVTFTDSEGNVKTVDFVHNATAGTPNDNAINTLPNLRLADDSNYSIYPYEGANLTEDDYTFVGNEDFGHLIQVTQIYNNTGTDYTKDEVKFQDVMSGEIYASTFTAERTGTVSIDGKQYTVSFFGSGDGGSVTLKYPTSDSADANTWVMYPTIETKNGALILFYEPLWLNLSSVNGTTGNVSGTGDASPVINFPDGDGYTGATMTYGAGSNATVGNWTMSGAGTEVLMTGEIDTTTAAHMTANATIGQLTYVFRGDGSINSTWLYLQNPESTAVINNTGLLIIHPKNDQSRYEAIFVDIESSTAGTSTDGIGVNDILFSGQEYHDSATLASDSDFTKDVDWFGAITTKDASDSDQKKATINLPKEQVYAQLYLGAADSSVTSSTTATGTTQLGDVVVKDSEVASVSSKNLVVVGGSCINSVAATVLGGAYCGAGFTEQTGVGSGQFLIQSFADEYTTGKVALLVAGYDASDTVNAAKYLRTNTVDTADGMKYKGTSSTSAELVTETA
ncbi:MAG: hypothetical protein ABIH49_02820 [archaeon]